MGTEEQLRRRLRGLYFEELSDGLPLLSDGLLSLEGVTEEATRAQLVQELFRTAHSLKGAAHAAAVPEAIAACNRLESAFAAIRDGDLVPDAGLVTQLLAETDALSAVAAQLHDDPAADPRAGSADPAPPGEPDPAAPASSEPPPAPAPSPGSLRVTAGHVDEVLRRTAAGLTASRSLHEVVEQAVSTAEQVDAARSRLRAALHGLPAGTVAAGLDQLLDDASRAATALARRVETTDRALHQTSSGVADAVQRLRTQPFAEACSSLDRAVRDIAASTGKSARLVVTGEDVDVDRGVINALRDPLLHLVRNAVDHGVEAPDVRTSAGKPTTGTVEVVATLDGSLLHITVRDDGAGIDTARLRAAAARRNMALPAEDLELAFVPGLSSRPDVTDVSGRGVGLDAARARLEQLGGGLQVISRPTVGTEIHLTAPVTLAVLRVLLVRAGEQVVALPSASVDRVMNVEPVSLREVEGDALLLLDRRHVRAVSLAGALGFPAAPQNGSAGSHLGVVLPRGGDAVLVTDGLLDELEIAVQPVPARWAGAPGVLGVAVLPGGRPAVVVNPVVVGRAASSYTLAAAPTEQVTAPRILLAEDTVTTRALERSILEAAGYSVAVAVDGADAWQQLQVDGVDLVVSDVDMPRMSGIDLCRRIRASARLRELPIVLVTSLDSSADRQRGLEAGADAYVVKAEFQQGTVLDTIARLL